MAVGKKSDEKPEPKKGLAVSKGQLKKGLPVQSGGSLQIAVKKRPFIFSA